MYDFAHVLTDALEGITHSLCTLEFDDHRALYDWILQQLPGGGPCSPPPRQIEFSRLNLQVRSRGACLHACRPRRLAA